MVSGGLEPLVNVTKRFMAIYKW